MALAGADAASSLLSESDPFSDSEADSEAESESEDGSGFLLRLWPALAKR